MNIVDSLTSFWECEPEMKNVKVHLHPESNFTESGVNESFLHYPFQSSPFYRQQFLCEYESINLVHSTKQRYINLNLHMYEFCIKMIYSVLLFKVYPLLCFHLV